MKAVEEAVASFARASRHDLWPRFTARAAGVSTAEAREAMLDLVDDGLLDLWYVVLSDAGDEVNRYKHPEKAPVGRELVSYRGEEPDRFVVEPDDVYLMFSPSPRLERLVKIEGVPDPKAVGAGGDPSVPTSTSPSADERAPSSPRWNPEKQIVNIINVQGDYYEGDRVEGGKAGRDIVHGDRVGGDKVGGDQIDNPGAGNVRTERTTNPPATAPRNAESSRAIVATTLASAAVVFVVFVVLGITGEVAWEIALPAALGGGLLIAAAGFYLNHRDT